ncbi:hypothetical protein J7L00_04200 [Candidatus Bathyarchaeota archaeon]|nr:hypothetical protein [Candidatus Bathyarchaeota archaeon]
MDSGSLAIGIAIGILAGALIAFLILQLKQQSVGVIFERDSEGRITAIYQAPRP